MDQDGNDKNQVVEVHLMDKVGSVCTWKGYS